jgi:hypothetical protein
VTPLKTHFIKDNTNMVLINKSIFSGHPIIVRRVTFQGCVRVFDGGVTETGLRECDGVNGKKVLSIPSGLKSKMEC